MEYEERREKSFKDACELQEHLNKQTAELCDMANKMGYELCFTILDVEKTRNPLGLIFTILVNVISEEE
jgi:hypothetical protein